MGACLFDMKRYDEAIKATQHALEIVDETQVMSEIAEDVSALAIEIADDALEAVAEIADAQQDTVNEIDDLRAELAELRAINKVETEIEEEVLDDVQQVEIPPQIEEPTAPEEESKSEAPRVAKSRFRARRR